MDRNRQHDVDLVPLGTWHDHDDSGTGPPAATSAELVAFQPEIALRPAALPPSGGWRRALWELTGHRLSLVSRRERALAERSALLRRQLTRPWTVAFMSMKGGVGKTTTCTSVGHVFASQRGDLVVALDFNPDGGALVQRVGQETRFTISDLLAAPEPIERYADVRAFTSQARSRLQVLAANRDPRSAAALDAAMYWRARSLLGIHYSLLLLDCGTGLLTDAARAAVDMADQLVIVASASLDAAEVSFRTIEWLEQRGHAAKVRDAIAVINTLENDRRVRLDVIESVFRGHCRAVIRVPRDPHLRLGTTIELEALQRRTREAYVELAATLAEGFGLTEGS
jgi:putative peptide zinc metalloprotease protein